MTSLGTISSKEEPRIFVGGLSRDTTKQHLEDAFGRFGKVVEAQVKHKAAIGNTKDGHKRAQFSFKPMSSRSLPTTDISSLNHIEDPEEYFLAFERLEIADKELKRLRGEVATDLTQHQPLRTARDHRAGILGRSLPTIDFSVLDDIKDPEEYFSTFEQLEIADKELKRLRGEVATDLTQHQRSRTAHERRPGILGKRFHFTPSTDLIEPLSKIPSNTSSVVGSSVNLHPEATEELGTVFDAIDREGSVPDKDKPAVDLLEDLLSAYKTLDADAANAYLRKKLEVKSIDVGKMHPPEFYSTQRNDHRTLGNEVTNELDGLWHPDMLSSHVGSRLAAIPSLQSRISMINPSEDIQMRSPVLEADKTIHSKATSEVELTKSCFHENHSDKNSSRFDNHGHDASTGFDGSLEEEGNDKSSDAVIFAQPNSEVEDPRSGYMKQNDTESLASSTISSSGHDIDGGSVGLHAILQSEVNVVAEGEPVPGAEVSKNNSSPSKSALPVDWHSENLCILPEENVEVEENVETQRLPEAAGASQNRGHKKRVPKAGQNKQQSTSKRQKLTLRKQSIADAGLTWKSGVRRSTRIKSRPLEYWRGERFLYGRIHDSLATVIGVKYASPHRDGKAQVLKVKSFVPDKYTHLVAQAAAT